MIGILLCEEELLEGLEIVGHFHGLLFALHEGCQTCWYFYIGMADIVNDLLELGGVCCLQEEAYLAFGQTVLESLVTACSVGIQLITCL